ncbi:putative flavin-containing amine oxidase [Xylogone sp. PMI_703]|nr:putative flavin-containing amine oxidase [Xylogone sp. PMI_703]
MNIAVVGAGISGLYAALLLQREGHNVTIYEANSRIGGRIYTHRFCPDDGSYFEAGAMRIPKSTLHSQVYDLIRYLNDKSQDEHNKIELIPYILENENNLAYIQGQKTPLDDEELGIRLKLPVQYQKKSARQLLAEAVQPWLKLLHEDFDYGFSQILQLDALSFRLYLHLLGWPDEVIDFVELMNSQTNQYDLSFTEIIMQNLDFGTSDWTTIKGGMSHLTDRLADLVGWEHIHLNARVERILESRDGRVILKTLNTHTEQRSIFDKVLLAIPPSALQNIRDRPRWSFAKEQAIRSVHCEPLYKIGLHFRSRFWEKLSRPCFGGQSVTDLRFRWIVYPSNNLGDQGSGVLLLYCWMNDAHRIASIPRQQRLQLALHDLARYFSDSNVNVYNEFIDAFDICWSQESATGDAMFLPGQFSRFFDAARRPEGNIYFAGEHLSRHHTWIAGAIDSALYTVANILGKPAVIALGDELRSSVKL